MSLSGVDGRGAVSAGVVELAAGVDAFYFSGRRDDPPELLCLELAGLQATAAAERLPQPFEVSGETFYVQSHGWRQYTFLLKHPFGRIGVTASPQFPAFRVQPETVALHGLGAAETVGWFERIVSELGGEVEFTVSRLDLYSDVQGWVPTAEVEHVMVCRSRDSQHYLTDGRVSSLSFGRRKTGGVLLRLYDKTCQVRDEGLDYWYGIWGDRFDPSRPVWRVEFEFGRKALRSFGVNANADVFERVSGLWASASSELFRVCEPTADQTRSRWPTAAEWAAVQRSALRADAVPLERLQELKRAGSLRRLQGPVTGMLSSFGALTDSRSLDDVLDALPDYLGEYEDWTGRAFMERIEEKRRR